jgi:hypothetical protein
MQRAARKVAEENLRLRSLLASHGVAQEEVEAYLRSFDVASATHPYFDTSYASPTSRQSGTAKVEQDSVRWTEQPHARPLTQLSAEAQRFGQSYVGAHVIQHMAHHNQEEAVTIQPSHEPGLPIALEASSFPKVADSYNETEDSHSVHGNRNAQAFPIEEEDADCPNTTSCFCAPTTTIKERPLETGLLISCETAATIIAEMRGDGDRHRIRASLGCHGDKECNVKNSIVLELMDER